jgi:hypothetical protein
MLCRIVGLISDKARPSASMDSCGSSEIPAEESVSKVHDLGIDILTCRPQATRSWIARRSCRSG